MVSAGKQAGRAAKHIVLQKNVAAAVASGNPGAVGGALAANAVGYGLKHVPFKKLGLKNPGSAHKIASAVGDRITSAANGGALINKGDVRIGAKAAAKYVINNKLKGAQKKAGLDTVKRLDEYSKGKTPLLNKGDVKVAMRSGPKFLKGVAATWKKHH